MQIEASVTGDFHEHHDAPHTTVIEAAPGYEEQVSILDLTPDKPKGLRSLDFRCLLLPNRAAPDASNDCDGPDTPKASQDIPVVTPVLTYVYCLVRAARRPSLRGVLRRHAGQVKAFVCSNCPRLHPAAAPNATGSSSAACLKRCTGRTHSSTGSRIWSGSDRGAGARGGH